MKKVLSIMLVLCVAASLFAVGTVKVGGVFEFVKGNTKGSEYRPSEVVNYKTHGFGFNIEGTYDVANNLEVFADFAMTFNHDMWAKYSNQTDWNSFRESFEKSKEALKPYNFTGSLSINSISIAAGAAYKLPVASSVDVAVGGGLFFERIATNQSAKDDVNGSRAQYTKFINLGLSAYANATYKITEQIGVGLTVMPRLGLFNSFNTTYVEDGESAVIDKASGFAFGFAMPIVVGASYAF